MNLQFYENFLKVVDNREIKKTAEDIGIAQSAVSKQLKVLEAAYGVTLLGKSRGKHSMEVTEAGWSFYRRAREMVKIEKLLKEEMKAFIEGKDGTLRLSVSPVTMGFFLEKYLIPFAELHPNVNFQMREEVAAKQLENLNNKIVDVAFTNAPLPKGASFNKVSVGTQKFYAVYRADGRFADAFPDKISIDSLHKKALSTNSGSLELLQKLCRRHGFDPQISFLANSGAAAVKFAEGGSAVAVVSAVCCDKLRTDMKKSYIDSPLLEYQQHLCWPKHEQPNKIMEAFLRFVFKLEGINRDFL